MGADTYQWEVIRMIPLSLYPILEPPAANSPNLEVMSNTNGQMDIMVIGTHLDGCAATDTVHINFSDKEYYFVPNAFTPNGDNLNDLVKIYLSGYNFVHFKVYNRRGQQLFFTTDKTHGWDGTFRGEKMPMETYFWMAKLKTIDNREFVVGGDVILMR